jgi:hypothetical protein
MIARRLADADLAGFDLRDQLTFEFCFEQLRKSTSVPDR